MDYHKRQVYNFSAGPATLPDSVLDKVAAELYDWRGTGVSVMEIGHRTELFQDFLSELQLKIKSLLKVPDGYHVLMMHGGGQGLFAALPMNLTKYNRNVDYIVTGIWSRLAMQSASKYADVNVVNTDLPNAISPVNTWNLSSNPAYVFYCINETVHGVEFKELPPANGPLVADVTSIILSCELDISKFGIIFAAMQKNLGIAGATLTIVRDDLLRQSLAITPDIWNFEMLVNNNSTVNTPPTFAIYMLDKMVDWAIDQGGVDALSLLSVKKSSLLYSCIDELNHFYYNPVLPQYRSTINVPFFIYRTELLSQFLAEAAACNLKFLKGHKAMGGLRASLYNAMPYAGVECLVKFLREFAYKHA